MARPHPQATLTRPPAPPTPPATPAVATDGDRRLLGLLLIALALVGVVLTAADAPPQLRAPLVLVVGSLLPGYPLVVRLPVSVPVLLALDVCASLAVETATAFVLVEADAWHPRAAGLVLTGVAVGAALVVVQDLRTAPLPLRRPALPSAHWAVPVLALLLWVVSITRTDLTGMGSGGLVPVLHPAWWVALALVLLSAGWLVTAGPLRPGLLLAHLGTLLLVLYATAPALEDTPRYTYTYKHVAITQYIERYGSVDAAIDIYHRWPGFFGLSALFSQTSGLLDPVHYAAWAELYFSALDVLLVWACAVTVARSSRTAWQAALLFAVGNWVGQDYYSPQALGFVLMLGIVLLCLLGLRHPAGPFGRFVERVLRPVLRLPVATPEPHDPAWDRFRGRLLLLVALMDVVLAATHQLTPYVLLMQLGALVVGGYLRPWVVVLLTAVATLGYLAPNLSFIVNKYGLFSSTDPLANARTGNADGVPGATQALIARLALGSAAAMFLLGFAGLVRRARSGRVDDAVVVGALAYVPVFTLVAQDYGGEGRLRVFLFALPWLSLAMSWLWSPQGRPVALRQALVATAMTVALTVAFVGQFLGREDINVLTKDEVGAAAFLFNSESVAPGAVIVLTAPSFPARYGPLYFRLARSDLPVLSTEGFGELPLAFPTQKDVDAVVTLMRGYGGSQSFLVFSKGQEAYARDYQLFPPYALPALEGVVASSSRFRLVYDTPSARIYQLVDGP